MPTLNDQEFTRSATYTVGVTPASGPFPVPFPFYDPDTIRMFIDGVETTAFTVTQASLYSTQGNTITLDAPVSDAVVVMWSDTGPVRATGDSFVQAELSKEIDRLFANLQEMWERGIWLMPTTSQYDAATRRISNLVDPVDPQDAATMGWATDYVDAVVAGLDGSIEAVAEFRRLYLGSASLDPVADNLGDPVQEGALYWNIPNAELRVYTSGAWASFAAAGGTVLPNILPGDGQKYVAVKADETGYEYVTPIGGTPAPAPGESFVLVAGVDGPYASPGHIPFGRKENVVGNSFVAPYDMTLDGASMNVTRSAGLRVDMSVSLRVNGVDTQIFSHVAGWGGIDTKAVSVPITKGDTLELVYACANNYNMAIAFALHFTAGVGGGRFPIVLHKSSLGGSETSLNPGEQTAYNTKVPMPVNLKVETAQYHTNTVAAVNHDVTLYVGGSTIATGMLLAGQLTLDFPNLNATVLAGQTLHAGVNGNWDAGSPSVTFNCVDDSGQGAPSHPFIVIEAIDTSNAGAFTPGEIVMPFDGTLTYAALTSSDDYGTAETVSVAVNGGTAQTLATLSGTAPLKVENAALSIAFVAGDTLTFQNTGFGTTGAGGTLTVGLTLGGTATVVAPDLPTIKTTDAGRVLTVNAGANGLKWLDPSVAVLPGGAAQTHQYWRIVGLSKDNASYYAVAELTFRDDAGADMTGGAVTGASATSERAGWEAINAFDRNASTAWSCASGFANPALGYDFGSAVAPMTIDMTARNDSFPDQTPRDFRVEYSDDNVTWTELQTFTGTPSWVSGETKSFTLSAQTAGATSVPGPQGDPGTSVRYGSDTTTALLGDVYFHTDGNLYQIVTLGSDKTAQTLMGAWTAAEKGWEPFGGAGTDPTIFAHTYDVPEFATPFFEAGYDYQMRWYLRGSLVNIWPLLIAEKTAGALIQPGTGYFDICSPTVTQIGGATIINPVAVQDYLQIEKWSGRVTYGLTADQFTTLNKSEGFAYHSYLPTMFSRMRMKCNAGNFITGSYCKLYRRKTAA